jgi:hypothetical protein
MHVYIATDIRTRLLECWNSVTIREVLQPAASPSFLLVFVSPRANVFPVLRLHTGPYVPSAALSIVTYILTHYSLPNLIVEISLPYLC